MERILRLQVTGCHRLSDRKNKGVLYCCDEFWKEHTAETDNSSMAKTAAYIGYVEAAESVLAPYF